MRNEDTSPLPRDVRAFIVLVALLQALLLYLADTADAHLWGWLAWRAPQVFWYTLVLAVPTVLTLSVRRLAEARFWQHAAGVAVVYVLLAGWAAWSVTGAPGIDVQSVLLPFGITAGGALFIALPFLQCRLDAGRWRAAYPGLFDHAWQNGLTLALAALFTGVCWLVLLLWAGLFKLVHIHFFDDLFFRQKSFAYLATGLFVGLGILIGRTQQHPLRVTRQILFAVCRGLLPLLALIALMFLASLPFTGLAPLWSTRSAATLLLALLLLLVTLVNAVWQDGAACKPYPHALRWLVDTALVLSPIYAALALYALGLRIHQYGWSNQRFWATLVAVVLAAHAIGYAVAALRRKQPWLGWLPRVNIALAGLVVALVLLANSPALDPYRIVVANQLDRLHAGRTTPAKLDVASLRFDNGRRGYRAAVALQLDPVMRANAEALAGLQRTVRKPSRYGDLSHDKRDEAKSVAALRAQIRLAPGATPPNDDWYRVLLGRANDNRACVLRGADCVLLTPDLRGDGHRDNLLCNLGGNWLVGCRLFTRDAQNAWHVVGTVTFEQDSPGTAGPLRAALRAGKLEAVWPRWPDLRVAGIRARISLDCDRDCDSPTPAASVSTEHP